MSNQTVLEMLRVQRTALLENRVRGAQVVADLEQELASVRSQYAHQQGALMALDEVIAEAEGIADAEADAARAEAAAADHEAVVAEKPLPVHQRMSRKELDEIAERAGVFAVADLPNRRAVVEAIDERRAAARDA